MWQIEKTQKRRFYTTNPSHNVRMLMMLAVRKLNLPTRESQHQPVAKSFRLLEVLISDSRMMSDCRRRWMVVSRQLHGGLRHLRVKDLSGLRFVSFSAVPGWPVS